MKRYPNIRGFLAVEGTGECSYISSKGLWDALVKVYGEHPPEGKGTLPHVAIPRANATFSQTRWMSTCLFDATRKYVAHNYQTHLSQADEDKFHAHPFTEPPGTPQPYTLRVVSDLIRPYGLAVSRVRMVPGRALTGDLPQWLGVLGTNPLALADNQTDNLAFAQMTGQHVGDVDSEFRFEFSPAPMRPAICCGYMHKATDNGAGHAEYHGIGDEEDTFVIQVQLARVDEVKYYTQPVFPELPAKRVHYVLNPWETKDKEGKIIQLAPEPTLFQTFKKRVFQPVSGWDKPLRYDGECTICMNTKLSTREMVGEKLCIRCWAVFTSMFRCPRCGELLGGRADSTQVAPFRGIVRHGSKETGFIWRIATQCVECQTVMHLKAEPDKAAWAVAAALRGEDGIAALYQTTKQVEPLKS